MIDNLERDKERLVAKLKSSICKVSFTKRDGSLREMICTLAPSKVPHTGEVGVKRTKAENPDVLPVYDTESQGWRSWRWDSLISFEELEEV